MANDRQTPVDLLKGIQSALRCDLDQAIDIAWLHYAGEVVDLLRVSQGATGAPSDDQNGLSQDDIEKMNPGQKND